MRLVVERLNSTLPLFPATYADDEAAALEVLARPYNRHLGPITGVLVHPPDATDLPLFSASARHGRVPPLVADLAFRPGTGDGPTIPGGGKGATLGAAVRGALGEASERLLAVLHYSSAASELRFGTRDQLLADGLDALGPRELPLFAAEQEPELGGRWAPFTDDTPLRWIRGRRLRSGGPVWLPAQLVLLSYERAKEESPIGYPTTGGLGFHADHRRAVLHGLYEWIERDAINLSWTCRLVPRLVEVDLPAIMGQRPLPDVDIRVLLNTLDLPVPVITVVARDPHRAALAFLGGGGAWSTRDRALRQALHEIAQCRAVLGTLEAQPLHIRPDSAPDEMSDFLDATVFYGYRENSGSLDWYLSGASIAWEDVPSHPFASVEAEWAWVMGWLEGHALDPVVVDLGGACWPGATVVKVIVPELTPAWVPADPLLGHPRYRRIRLRTGRTNRTLAFGDLNRQPLPFP